MSLRIQSKKDYIACNLRILHIVAIVLDCRWLAVDWVALFEDCQKITWPFDPYGGQSWVGCHEIIGFFEPLYVF